jgi:hypothetical protein
VFALVQHRRFILLAFADDDGAAHRDGVAPGAWRRCSVDQVLVAAAEVAGRGDRGGLDGVAGRVGPREAVRPVKRMAAMLIRRGSGPGGPMM